MKNSRDFFNEYIYFYYNYKIMGLVRLLVIYDHYPIHMFKVIF